MSYRIATPKSRKAATRFVGKVRRQLQKALADNPDITRTQIADAIGVHRSVITRQLNGHADMSLGRVAEIAWATGFRPQFGLEALDPCIGSNRPRVIAPARDLKITSIQTTSNNVAEISNVAEIKLPRILVEAK
jgi:hypothetical protein